MAVLYHWQRNIYLQNMRSIIREPQDIILEQNAATFGALAHGERIWAFTRNSRGEYIIAAQMRVDRVIDHEIMAKYGRFEAIPIIGSTTMYDIETGHSVERLIRGMQIRVKAPVLGSSFQGNAAVRKISTTEDEALDRFAAALPIHYCTGKPKLSKHIDSFSSQTYEFLDRADLTNDQILTLAKYLGVDLTDLNPASPRSPENLIQALKKVPAPLPARGKFAHKRVVRSAQYLAGGNPRTDPSGHGYKAYCLIPTGPDGIRVEDLLARIRQLPVKSSPKYGAGGRNHIQRDLDRNWIRLEDDPGLEGFFRLAGIPFPSAAALPPASSAIPTHSGLAMTSPPIPARRSTPVRTFKGKHTLDPAERDAVNRTLGQAGEALVVEHEKQTLAKAGRYDLISRVRNVAELEGDGAGYDIESANEDGSPKYIEVKTTKGPAGRPFIITANEVAFADLHSSNFFLYRIFGYDAETNSGRMFVHRGSLHGMFELEAVQFRARIMPGLGGK